MHLIYIDESGNTGRNLTDPQQPVFVLGALVVPEGLWQSIENALEKAIKDHGSATLIGDEEIHGVDLRQGTGIFKGVSVSDRLNLRDAWLQVAIDHNLHLIYRAIVKRGETGEGGNGECAARLVGTTAEFDDLLAEVFGKNATHKTHGVTGPQDRLILRAQIDALVARLYDLTIPEF